MNSTFAESPGLRPPEADTAPLDTTRPPRPRVCFVAPTTWPMMAGSREIPVIGGAELQQSVIAPELARRGYDVSMISMDFGQEEGSHLKGVRLLTMHKPDAGLPVVRFLHPRLTSLWAAMKRADADVISLLDRLGFGQTDAADLGVAIGAARHVGVVERLHIPAGDPFGGNHALHRRHVRELGVHAGA